MVGDVSCVSGEFSQTRRHRGNICSQRLYIPTPQIKSLPTPLILFHKTTIT